MSPLPWPLLILLILPLCAASAALATVCVVWRLRRSGDPDSPFSSAEASFLLAEFPAPAQSAIAWYPEDFSLAPVGTTETPTSPPSPKGAADPAE